MSENIIDDVSELMKLNEDELDELLLQEKYNKANLRELIRRLLTEAHQWKAAFHYEKQEHDMYRNKVGSLLNRINN